MDKLEEIEGMDTLSKEKKKLRARIKRYERELVHEQQTYGIIRDGAGKRYLLGPFYLMLDDLTSALEAFDWFERTFPGDSGEPFFYLCWTLALYRAGDREAATNKLRQTMLANLYLIPHLLGLAQAELNIWHGSNLEEPDYLSYAQPGMWDLWDEAALQWFDETYHQPALTQVRDRYIDIFQQLLHERPSPKRTALVREAFQLRDGA